MFNVSTKISMQFLGEFIFRVFILAYNPTKAFDCLYNSGFSSLQQSKIRFGSSLKIQDKFAVLFKIANETKIFIV